MEFALPNYALGMAICIVCLNAGHLIISSKDSGLESCKFSLNGCNYLLPFKHTYIPSEALCSSMRRL